MATDVFKSLKLSRKIPDSMKVKISKYLTSSGRYKDGLIFGLSKPSAMVGISKKIQGCSMGADKNGFFVYTHRCRSKSYPDPLKIPKKDIDFVESTG